MDIDQLNSIIEKHGADKIAFCSDGSAALTSSGGQPFSLENLAEVRARL